ncbi:MAG: hypothetical protein AAGA76_04235, partial [Pseudomonadota bacterium]
LQEQNYLTFEKTLEKSVASGIEQIDKVHVETGHIKSDFSLKYVPLEKCGRHGCCQTVLVVAQPAAETEQFDTQCVAVKNEPINIIDAVEASTGAYTKNCGVQVCLKLKGEPDDFPKVLTDQFVLQQLLTSVCDCVLDGQLGSRPLFVEIQRLARAVKVKVYGSASGEPSHALQIAGVANGERLARSTEMEKLSNALSAKMKFSGSREHADSIDILVPINANVALPDPENFGSDIVRIRKAANGNFIANPLPRFQKTG